MNDDNSLLNLLIIKFIVTQGVCLDHSSTNLIALHSSMSDQNWQSSMSILSKIETGCLLSLRPFGHKATRPKAIRLPYAITPFWGLFLNSVAPIRFTPCGIHVIIMWHCAMAIHCCAWERLMPCHAKTMRRHANHMTCCILRAPKSAMYTRSFPSLSVGSGNESSC